MVGLAGTKWRVVDLLGQGVLEDAQPDVMFDEDSSAYGWLSLFQQPLAVWLAEPYLGLDGDAGTTLLVRVRQVEVSGSVLYRERIAMPTDAVVQVDLRDTSRADAQAPLVAQQRIEQPSSVPVPFRLRADEDEFAPPARLSLSVRIEASGVLWWTTDTNQPVTPDQIEHELLLVRVSPP
jgi:uncharacterized lipoprotein YbaY